MAFPTLSWLPKHPFELIFARETYPFESTPRTFRAIMPLGGVAQMVEHSFRIRGVRGSMPLSSIVFSHFERVNIGVYERSPVRAPEVSLLFLHLRGQPKLEDDRTWSEMQKNTEQRQERTNRN